MQYNIEDQSYEIEKKSTYINDYDMIAPLLDLIGLDDSRVRNYTTRKVIYNLHSQHPTHLHNLSPQLNDIILSKKSCFKIPENGGTYA